MKKTIILLLILGGLMTFSNRTAAGEIPILYSDGLTFETQHQLPDSIIVDGKHVNLGIAYKQFAIFWIPIWNYGTTEYVLVSDNEKDAYDLSEEGLAWLKEEYNINTDKAPSISFWNKIGGKLIWGGFILLLIWGAIPSKKNKEEETAPQE
ncbi:MAG: hypothetical protein LBQ28_09950 [Prevotellaceae bacterium]|jgi:hypothetical protein|nr:hypothetical protein [Prevotellaceae bacterium]